MALGDDPFNGRINMFKSEVNPGRQTVNLEVLKDRGDFRFIDDTASDSNRGSLVSGHFGALGGGGAGSNSIKTPGFNADKKFSFLDGSNANDGNSDDI